MGRSGPTMVCADCEKKSEFTNRSVICPDPWKDGSRNSVSGGAGRSVNENKLLSKKRGAGSNPYDVKCQLCKQRLHDGGIFCQDCAYSKGLCRLCGKVVLKGREFYKSFYSEENEKKFAPKKRDASEVAPDGECGDEPEQPSGGAAAEDTEAKPVKKVKKVKKSDGSDASKAKALEAAAAMKDFVLDNATGMY